MLGIFEALFFHKHPWMATPHFEVHLGGANDTHGTPLIRYLRFSTELGLLGHRCGSCLGWIFWSKKNPPGVEFHSISWWVSVSLLLFDFVLGWMGHTEEFLKSKKSWKVVKLFHCSKANFNTSSKSKPTIYTCNVTSRLSINSPQIIFKQMAPATKTTMFSQK